MSQLVKLHLLVKNDKLIFWTGVSYWDLWNWQPTLSEYFLCNPREAALFQLNDSGYSTTTYHPYHHFRLASNNSSNNNSATSSPNSNKYEGLFSIFLNYEHPSSTTPTTKTNHQQTKPNTYEEFIQQITLLHDKSNREKKTRFLKAVDCLKENTTQLQTAIEKDFQPKAYNQVTDDYLKRRICSCLSPSKVDLLASNFEVFTLKSDWKGRSFKGEYAPFDKMDVHFPHLLNCSTDKNYIFVNEDGLELQLAVVNTEEMRANLFPYNGDLSEFPTYMHPLSRKNMFRQGKGKMHAIGLRGGYKEGVSFGSYVPKKQPPNEWLTHIFSFMEALSNVGGGFFPEMWGDFWKKIGTVLPPYVMSKLSHFFFTNMTITFDYASMLHSDYDWENFAIGFFCNVDGKKCSATDTRAGEFFFSEWGIKVPFHHRGTVMMWNTSNEHCTLLQEDWPDDIIRLGCSMQVVMRLLEKMKSALDSLAREERPTCT